MIEGELGFLKAFTNKTNFEALTNASRSGLTLALLAQKNAKTPVDMIEGELGFLKAFTNKTNFEALTNASRSGLTFALLAQKR